MAGHIHVCNKCIGLYLLAKPCDACNINFIHVVFFSWCLLRDVSLESFTSNPQSMCANSECSGQKAWKSQCD